MFSFQANTIGKYFKPASTDRSSRPFLKKVDLETCMACFQLRMNVVETPADEDRWRTLPETNSEFTSRKNGERRSFPGPIFRG